MVEGVAGSAPTIGANVRGGWVTKAIIVQIQVRQTGRREAMESTECETSHSRSRNGRKEGSLWAEGKLCGRELKGEGGARRGRVQLGTKLPPWDS